MKITIGLLITTMLSGFGVYVFDKLWGNSFNWKELKVKSYNLPWLYILLFVLLVLVGIFLYRKFVDSNSFYTRKEKRLRKNNRRLDVKNGLLFKWNVYFSFSNEPFIGDLTVFCTLHGDVPRRCINGSCTIDGCQNKNKRINMHFAKNQIESELIHEWDQINGQ